MLGRVRLALVCTLILPGGTLFAQSPDVSQDDQKIIAYEKQNSELMTNLEYLCDMIGPRLTGSARLKRANEWTAEKMKEYGLENVHLESYTIPDGWERGKVEAQIVEPNGMAISIAQMAWTPGTHGTVTGPVIELDLKPDASDIDKYKGKLRNAIILMSKPASVDEHPSRTQPRTGGLFGTDEVAQPPAGGQPRGNRDYAAMRQRVARINEFLSKEGVAAVLRDAGKPQMLLNMTGSWRSSGRSAPTYPTLFVAHEHYAMLDRLLSHSEPVTMRLKVECRFVRGPVTVYNTVGEIKGSEKPDEVVLCGGHLDSWDLGQGAVDNGTGSTTVLEAARLIKMTGLKPKRTVRFVLFSGEEEGLVGSREYVRAHKAELGKFSAVFVHDTGTGKVTGIGLHGNPQDQNVFENGMPVLKELGVERYSVRPMGGTDHASFYPEGVPGFWFMQESTDYDWMHHTQSDTLDKALPDDLKQGATVMAVCAYNVAQLPDMLPRRTTTAGSGTERPSQ